MTNVDDARVSPLKFFTLVITSQPADVAGVIGGQAVFSATFLTNNPTLVTYQWQCSTDGGTTWGNLLETVGYYEGVTTTSLTVKAIDNFLATRSNLQFRCRALFSGSVPTYTNAARLTVAVHTTWVPSIVAKGQALTGADVNLLAFVANLPDGAGSGFPGPYTFSWARISGSAAITALSPLGQDASWHVTGIAAGIIFAIWQCTISNGANTVTSDPVYVAAYGSAAPSAAFAVFPVPPAASNGSPMHVPGNLIPPWRVLDQTNIRTGALAAVTADSPNADQTTFSLNNTIGAGTCVSALVFALATPVGDNQAYFGNANWFG